MTAQQQASHQQQVARTILEQLGGSKFIMMTGAKQFCSGRYNDKPCLTFRIPRSPKNSIRAVRITLDEGKDLYDVDFLKVKDLDLIPVANHEGIDCELLADLFKQETGLHTTL